MQQVLATENRIAKLFQFSERKVRDYFKAARVAPGKYDLLQVIEIFVEKNSGKDEASELKRADKDLKEYKYGEEKKSKFIAQYIVKNRPITTTLELVDIINDAVGNKYFNLNHPERRIFQALRIEVNQELKVIEAVLPQVIDLLKPEGRCAIITFHSLEDRIVKQYFKTQSKVNELVKGLPEIPLEYKPKIKLITKKPLTASKEELQENSRSKSAKLRVIERI